MTTVSTNVGLGFAGKKAASSRPKFKSGGVNPATCDKKYSPEEWEFMSAVRDYQDQTGRKFPTLIEYLNIAKGLGYAKAS